MEQYRHKIGLIGLTAIGIGTMIGSGWLFSAYYAAKFTGPLAYVAWIFASVIVLVLGLLLSEIASIYPKRGLMARLLVISHTKEFAFVCTITTWLGLTAVIATEAEGSIQYLSSLSESLRPYLFDVQAQHLTHLGVGLSIGMVLIFGVINFWGIKFMSQSNVALTVAKVLIPLITALAIIWSSFHADNFHEKIHGDSSFGLSSILIAMIGAGMIYAFNGFQNIVSFSSEAKHPKRNIPLAMFLSIVITLVIYLLLQSAFIGALTPQMLAKGWGSLDFTSPFVQLTMMLNLNLVSIILYIDAFTSPSGTGLIYMGSTTRMLTGMSQDKQMPSFFNKMSKYNFSRRSLMATIILAILFLVLFRSWASLVAFLSLFYIVSYMSIPLCIGKLRHHKRYGQFKMPAVKLLAPVMFVLLSCLFMFSAFPYTTYVASFILVAFILYVIAQYKTYGHFGRIIKQACPILIHILLLGGLSSLGPHRLGGMDFFGYPAFFVIVAFEALCLYGVCIFIYNNEPEPLVESY